MSLGMVEVLEPQSNDFTTILAGFDHDFDHPLGPRGPRAPGGGQNRGQILLKSW